MSNEARPIAKRPIESGVRPASVLDRLSSAFRRWIGRRIVTSPRLRRWCVALLRDDQHAVFDAIVAEDGGRLALDLLDSDDGSLLRRAMSRDNFASVEALLNENDSKLLRDLLRKNEDVLESILSDSDYALWRKVAVKDQSRAMKAVLFADGYAPLKRLLSGQSYEALQAVLFDNDYAVWRELAVKRQSEPLKAVLFADGHAVLKKLVSLRSYEALHAVLFDDDGAVFRQMAVAGQLEPLRKLLLDNQSEVLRRVVQHNGYAALDSLMSQNDYELWRTLAMKNQSAALKAVLFAEDYAALKRLLAGREYEALQAILFQNDAALFRDMALKKKKEPLKSVLFARDYEVLRSILLEKQGEPLQHILFADSYAAFRTFALRQKGAPIKAVLMREGEDLLVNLLNEDDGRPLEAALGQGEYKLLRTLFRAGREDVLARFLVDRNQAGMQKLLLERGLISGAMQNERIAGAAALETTWRRLRGLFPADDADLQAKFEAARMEIRSPDHVRGRILDMVTQGDRVRLAHGELRFTDRHSLWTLIHEILSREDYYFECETDTPRILDCGTHFGMAIYYFKSLFPRARVTGFEPVPALRALAEENVRLNSYADVEVLPFALSDRREAQTFYVSDTYTMAGSLLERREEFGDDVREIAVECRPLSAYLDEPVHFLKLDIEGSEDAVMREAEPKLRNVQHLFCEYHEGLGLASNRMSEILDLLSRAGFDFHVAKSHNFQRTSANRPMTYVGKPASEVIWARNRNWPPAPPA